MANFISSLKGSRTKWDSLTSLKPNSIYYVIDDENNTMDVYFAPSTDKSRAILLSTRVAKETGGNKEEQPLNDFLETLHKRIVAVEENSGKMFNVKGKIEAYTIGDRTYYQVITNDNETNEYTSMPDADSGDVYQVLSDGIYGGNTCSSGDWIICSTGGTGATATWVRLDSSIDLSNVEFTWLPDKHSLQLSGSGINTEVKIPLAKNDDTAGLMTNEQSKKVTELINKGWISPENKADGESYGIVKLSDATDSELNMSDKTAATPKAVKSVNDALVEATKTLSKGQKEIVQGIEVNNAKHSTDSDKIRVQNEAGDDFHSDVHVLAKDEGKDGDGNAIGVRLHTNDKSDKVIVNEADHSAKSDVLVVEGAEYSVKAIEIAEKETRLQSTDKNGDKNGIVSVDLADDLGGRQETTPEEFIYQPTAGEYKSIKDGMASIKSLKGNSVVWNQCDNMAALNNLVEHGLTYTYDSNNNILTINGTANSTDLNYLYGVNYGYKRVAKGRVVYSSIEWLSGSITGGNVKFTHGNTDALQSIGIRETIKTVTNDYFYFLIIGSVSVAVTFDNVKIRTKLIDLTQMFQEGNEPTTIEEFNARKPKVADEYAYNEGEIISFNGDAIKSVGFNQFDGQLEQGRIDTVGDNQPQALMVRSKNYIPVISGAKYYFNVQRVNNTTVYTYPYYYDKDKKYISDTFFPNDSPDRVQTIPSNAAFMRFFLYQNNATLKPSDFADKICINLSHTGFRNGEYEPYTEHTLYLPKEAQDMKSAGAAYDEIYFDEAKKKYFKVQRMGEVNLGDLGWRRNTLSQNMNQSFWFGTPLPSDIKPYISSGTKANHLSSCYINYEWDDLYREIVVGTGFSQRLNDIVIQDDSYTDAASFKAAMKGVKLIYELAEPIITEISDYEGYMDYPVSDFGTEEVLSLGNTAPLRADIQYGFNAVDTIRNNRLDINKVKKEVVNANVTANEAKSLAENAEDYATQARDSIQELGDHLNKVTLSGSSVDNGYNIDLSDDESTNNPTMPNGDGVSLQSSITIPNATASGNGVMSKEDKSWLDDVKGGTSSVAKTDAVVSIYLGSMEGKAITALQAAINDIQSRYVNNDAFIRIRFGAKNTFIGEWNNILDNKGNADFVIETGQQWVLQPIGYIGFPNYGSWILSTYEGDRHYIVAKNNSTWGYIRRIAFIDSKVDRASTAESLLSDGEGEIRLTETVTGVKETLKSWIENNPQRFNAFTFFSGDSLVDAWNNYENEIAGSKVQWTAVNIGVQSSGISSGTYATFLLSSFNMTETYIVSYLNGSWSNIRQNVHIETIIPKAGGLNISEISEEDELNKFTHKTITAVQCDDAMNDPYAVVVSIGTGGENGVQLMFDEKSDKILFRRKSEGGEVAFTDWKEIATTESTVQGAYSLVLEEGTSYLTEDIINALTWGDF